jgi:hypothetical protein
MFKWFLDRVCPDSLEAKDIALSRRKPGFKSRSGHKITRLIQKIRMLSILLKFYFNKLNLKAIKNLNLKPDKYYKSKGSWIKSYLFDNNQFNTFKYRKYS